MLYPEFWLLVLSKSKIYEPGETVKLHEIINLLLRSREQVCTWRIFFVGQLKNIRHVRSYNIFKKVITREGVLIILLALQLYMWKRSKKNTWRFSAVLSLATASTLTGSVAATPRCLLTISFASLSRSSPADSFR